MTAPARGSRSSHPTMGDYVSTWRAWAVDDRIRRAGGSAGVLTALSTWLVDSGGATAVVAAASDGREPRRTVPVRITTAAQALDAAGSRYAPVATCSSFDPTDPSSAFVGKPCEVDAARRLVGTAVPQPHLLSFFCAGVPSQHATDELVEHLGVDPAAVTALRYRGDGWPGEFRVDSEAGRSTLTYEESWGQHLGRRLQDRCKICPDGTGTHADVVVGDLWEADERGFPEFSDRPGSSVAIARTPRGHDLLQRARTAGVLALEAIDIDEAAQVQPYQKVRLETLLGRLVGRRAAGLRVPRVRGYHLTRLALTDLRRTVRFARGSWRRARLR